MSRTLVAAGNIRPSRFVEPVGSTSSYECTECNAANDKVWGISQEGANTAPIPGATTTYAAAAGQSLKVYTPGDQDVLLELGGSVVAGDYLATDNEGRGVAATADQTYGARANEDGASGELIRVDVMHGSTESS